MTRPLAFNFIRKHLLYYLKNGLTLFVLSPVARKTMLACGYDPREIFVVPNATDHHRFTFREAPLHRHRSICLGGIDMRKQQHLCQDIAGIDFVGHIREPTPFDAARANYLGPWPRDKVWAHLSDYANLVLLSRLEAAPLVVLEAMVCGLGVVVSAAASSNLDTRLPWISVIPEEKITDPEFLQAEIARNREVSLRCRAQIRQYAIDHFSWETQAPRYADLCLTLRAARSERPHFAARMAGTLRRLRYFLPVFPSFCWWTFHRTFFVWLPHKFRRWVGNAAA